MSMDSTPPSKDTICQTGLKRKIQQSVVYNRTTLKNRNKHWLRMKDWKNIYKPIPFRKKGKSNNTYIRQSKLATFIGQMRQGHFILKKREQYIKRK
jgi:hypothetical protein